MSEKLNFREASITDWRSTTIGENGNQTYNEAQIIAGSLQRIADALEGIEKVMRTDKAYTTQLKNEKAKNKKLDRLIKTLQRKKDEN